MSLATGNQLLGVVLCGGKSERMGSEKALLQHHAGGTFVQYAIDRLAPLCQQVCVSGHVNANVNVTVYSDPVPFLGPASGIANTLHIANQQNLLGCLITAVDTPWIESEDLNCLVREWVSDSQKTCVVAYSDRIEPLIAIYPTTLASAFTQLAASEDRSLHRWLKQNPHRSISLPISRCRNVNFPHQLG